MNRNLAIALAIVIGLILGGLATYLYLRRYPSIVTNSVYSPTPRTTLTPTASPLPTATPSPTATITTSPTTLPSSIEVNSPAPNSVVKSPQPVRGWATGNWFFEGQFTLRILDANSRELGTGTAKATGEWTTPNFVPFSGAITFSNPESATGTLVFEKANPSGLPDKAESARMPIRFR